MKKYILKVLATSIAVAFTITTIASAASGGDLANGEKLWKKKKCNKCHHLTEKKKIGPGVKGVTQKRSEAWLIKWMADLQKTWEENGPETQAMEKWKKGRDKKKKTLMKTKKLSDQEIADLIAFMKKNDEN